jgi:CheY-like chemotaxis protein
MGLRVLVVEDHADSREALAALLSIWGHETVEAGTGADALRAVERFVPDVALVDLTLPDMDGAGLAWALSVRVRPRPFLIAVSGDARAFADGSCAGFDRCLLKPASPDDLQALLTACAAARRTA